VGTPADSDPQAEQDRSAPDPDASVQMDPLIRLAREPWLGDLGGMIERRMVRVLVVPSRTQYWLELGRYSGIEYELTAAFESWLKKRYPRRARHQQPRFVYIPTTVDRLMPDLVAGRGDIAAAMLTVTAQRGSIVDFSAPYARGVREVVVTGPAATPLQTLGDLAGREVCVRRSSSYWMHLQALNGVFASTRRPQMQLVAMPEVLSDDDILEMVNAGILGTTVVDFYEARIWRKIFTDLEILEAAPLNEGGELAWMIRKNSPELSAVLEEFMAGHRHGTRFGNTVERKYVGSDRFVRRATSEQEIAKLRHLRDLFMKYGDQYSLDWVLLAAQGYQESRLDQTARSGRGAVGVMQLMPSTARSVGINDVTRVDSNIHAAAKYSRELEDRYFSDEAIDELNRGLFAVAAYNAGPGRIQQLRRQTGERGLDPNVWFDNVEVLAAERVGAETVDYVANTFKYYVGFKLGLEKVQASREFKETVAPRADRPR
jgi:membrane-bound lytic murein transglycosylase MltF